MKTDIVIKLQLLDSSYFIQRCYELYTRYRKHIYEFAYSQINDLCYIYFTGVQGIVASDRLFNELEYIFEGIGEISRQDMRRHEGNGEN